VRLIANTLFAQTVTSKISTSGRIILPKGRIACRAVIEGWCFCCIHRKRDSQCFSVGRTTPKNCSCPWDDFDPI